MGTRALTMLNESGDTTMTWEQGQDEEMESIIQKKMDEGVTFFVIEPRFGGLLAPKRTKLEKVKAAHVHRALSIPDADLALFVGMGKGEAVKTPEAKVKGSRVSRSAKEVAKSESVGTKPLRGG